MKYSDLLIQLQRMTPEELKQDVAVIAERGGGFVESVWTADEDQINPSGEGIEPVSTYEDEDEDVSHESVVVPKGRVLLVESDTTNHETFRRASALDKLIGKIKDLKTSDWLTTSPPIDKHQKLQSILSQLVLLKR